NRWQAGAELESWRESAIGRRERSVEAEAVGERKWDGTGILAVIGDAISAADYEVLQAAIGDAESGGEIILVEIVRVLAEAVHAGKRHDACRAGYRVDGVRVKSALVIVGFPPRGIHVPTDAQVQGQPRTHLPIVLKIPSVIIGASFDDIG